MSIILCGAFHNSANAELRKAQIVSRRDLRRSSVDLVCRSGDGTAYLVRHLDGSEMEVWVEEVRVQDDNPSRAPVNGFEDVHDLQLGSGHDAEAEDAT
ncbi:hypothetical protein LTR62_004695 [Meristemomyces frigidus]|uniref:Uncharacterized protein n=1 Tax=Meristemomyces frigidus TaxID=1508187 RepID=A0AAN7TFX7_9PEZI|nr:hypothetical protein LTR62_004695 [Meristemomyces frigidus]